MFRLCGSIRSGILVSKQISKFNPPKFVIKENITFFGTYKTSTGLVGLAVDPNGRETLNNLSQQVLATVQVCSYVMNVNFIFYFLLFFVCIEIARKY
jgi:hypothetical protein